MFSLEMGNVDWKDIPEEWKSLSIVNKTFPSMNMKFCPVRIRTISSGKGKGFSVSFENIFQ